MSLANCRYQAEMGVQFVPLCCSLFVSYIVLTPNYMKATHVFDWSLDPIHLIQGTNIHCRKYKTCQYLEAMCTHSRCGPIFGCIFINVTKVRTNSIHVYSNFVTTKVFLDPDF